MLEVVKLAIEQIVVQPRFGTTMGLYVCHLVSVEWPKTEKNGDFLPSLKTAIKAPVCDL